jgi:hypothetical protein
MLEKLSLIAQYPLFRRASRISNPTRNKAFDTSCNILEWTHDVISNEETSKWSWLLQTYVHWHPVAFLLTEMGAAQDHDQARAWNAINLAWQNQHGLDAESNRALWRPLEGLLEKAKAVTTSPGVTVGSQDPPLPRVHVPGEGSVGIHNQALDNSLEFMPDSVYNPIGESPPGLEPQTPFLTMADFDQYQMATSQPWWIHENAPIPKHAN